MQYQGKVEGAPRGIAGREAGAESNQESIVEWTAGDLRKNGCGRRRELPLIRLPFAKSLPKPPLGGVHDIASEQKVGNGMDDNAGGEAAGAHEHPTHQKRPNDRPKPIYRRMGEGE